MAKSEHLLLLEQGVESWNAWRATNPEIKPRLRGAILRGADLRGANLRDADLAGANLQGARLTSADLTSANLANAHLSGANLDHAVLKGADLQNAVLGDPEILRDDFWQRYRYPGDDPGEVIWAPLENDKSLRYSEYVRYEIPEEELEEWRGHIMGTTRDEYKPATLVHSNLEEASLERTLCDRVSFRSARLRKAKLTGARLVKADFTSADLEDADLSDADLRGSILPRAARRRAKRGKHSDWADALAGAFEGSVQILTSGFHDDLTAPTHDREGDFHVTLIHGTFAGAAEWVDEDGALARQLALELEELDPTRAVQSHAFRWSGKNTCRARREAADDLRRHFGALFERYPTGIHCAVAHSHGGTVLLHALRDSELAGSIARVVCLATPFIRIVPTTEEWETTFRMGLKALAGIGLLALALWFGTPAPVLLATAGYPNLRTLLVGLVAIAALIAVSRGIDALLAKWKDLSRAIHGASGHPQLRLDQAICIRTAADEAGFALGLGATLAWLVERVAIALLVVAELPSYLLLRPLTGIRRGSAAFVIAAMSFVLVLLALYVVLLPQPSLLPAAYAVLGIVGLLLLPGILLVPVVLILSVCYLPFGHDLAICTPFLRATAEPTPTGIWRLFQFPNLRTLPLLKLQHSFLYEYSLLRTFIARWVIAGEFISSRDWREA